MSITKTLGLDCGQSTVGYAVTINNNGNSSLLCAGTNVFPVHTSSYNNKETPTEERRKSRSKRVQIRHRRSRMISLIECFTKYQLCPELSLEELKLWKEKSIFPSNPEFRKWIMTDENYNPYSLRVRLVHNTLDMSVLQNRYLLGRALYHIARHRGYISSRKSGKDKDGKVMADITALNAELAENGYMFYCELYDDIYQKNKSSQNNIERIRGHYKDGKLLEKEALAICEKQGLNSLEIDEIMEVLFFRLPLKSQSYKIKKCHYEQKKLIDRTVANKKCARIAHPLYEEYIMLQYVNNIKMDDEPLSDENRRLVIDLISHTDTKNFKFKKIIDLLGKKHKYNYSSSDIVTGCPTTVILRNVFGENYLNGISKRYRKNKDKDLDRCFEDMWNIIMSYDDNDKINQWLSDNLGLNDDEIAELNKISIEPNYGNLSLKAIKNISRFMKVGFGQKESVYLAKIPEIIGIDRWDRDSAKIISDIEVIIADEENRKRNHTTINDEIREYLFNNYQITYLESDKLYSLNENDKFPKADIVNGIKLLPVPIFSINTSPMVKKNVMMIRKIVNELLRNGILTFEDTVNIEVEKEVNDKNARTAWDEYSKQQNNIKEAARKNIIRLYKNETGLDIIPTDKDVLRYRLWEEQNHICLYTGKKIKISECVGPNLKFDIEHTIPLCRGGEYTMDNLTLCESDFNRNIKCDKVPYELKDYNDIVERCSVYSDKIKDLTKEYKKNKTNIYQTDKEKSNTIVKKKLIKFELDYCKSKFKHLTTDCTNYSDTCALWRGATNSTVAKYISRYFKTYFRRVNMISNYATAEFRKMWGIQAEDAEKDRTTEINHAVDATILSCIDFGTYSKYCEHYKKNYKKYDSFSVPKPWDSFTEDMLNLAEEHIVVHQSKDNVFKRAEHFVNINGKKIKSDGDSVKGSLHKETFYGIIEHNGERKCVIRKSLSSLKERKDLNSIVDDTVKKHIIRQFDQKVANGSTPEAALQEDYYIRGKKIRHLRFFVTDVTLKGSITVRTISDNQSKFPYKRNHIAKNDDVYGFCVYSDEKILGNAIPKNIEPYSLFEATQLFKASKSGHVSEYNENGVKFFCFLKKGIKVLFFENDLSEINIKDPKNYIPKLFYIKKMERGPKRITFVNTQYNSNSIKDSDGVDTKYMFDNHSKQLRITPGNYRMLVEYKDFVIDSLGNIKLKNDNLITDDFGNIKLKNDN